ncbi:MAG: Gfo/Idh/MocA family oxidoreductase [Bacillus sp. (in: Bacteria)]|nr:Gfo/Idh/MocA family oxidoreductase [Bacillus sp. (in: firmicutes)]
MIHIGIIGLGAVGERLLKAFVASNYEIKLSVCDTSEDRLREVRNTYSTEIGSTNYKDILKMADIDGVYVAVPPKFHEQIVLEAIEAGKHILCEKPLANSVEEAKRMLDAVVKSDLVHGMHFPLNYQKSIFNLGQLLEEKYVGTVRRINLTMHFPHWPRLWQQNEWVASREQGGFVLEVGVHWIQLIQRFFGKIRAVRSHLHYPDTPHACEIGIVAEMKLEDGTEVLIDGLSNISGEESLEFAVYGMEGTLKVRNWRQLLAGKKWTRTT